MQDGNNVVVLSNLNCRELLSLHARISDELRGRKMTRSENNPAGDIAEHLFCKAFDWKPYGNSNSHIDAVDADGKRYQIKARRMTRRNQSRQLSALRDLAGILFDEDYTILRAAIIPHAIALDRASFVQRTNSHKFFLRDDVWNAPGVRDVTAELRAVRL